MTESIGDYKLEEEIDANTSRLQDDLSDAETILERCYSAVREIADFGENEQLDEIEKATVQEIEQLMEMLDVCADALDMRNDIKSKLED
jgi:hypothetical protein